MPMKVRKNDRSKEIPVETKTTRTESTSRTEQATGLVPWGGSFDRMMEFMRRDMGEWMRPLWPSLPAFDPQGFLEREWRMPRMDIADLGESYEVAAELPGIPKDKVKVQVTPDGLDIRAEAESKTEEKKKGFYRREIGRRAFHRFVPLPRDADPNQVEARMEDGCLIVTLGKVEGAVRGTTIPVR